ncbi:MAG: nucleoside-diphosphate kinase [Deltaproteobacteria bacterium]|nr:nucleoside-diphosphate kinase [Deltaproteobacteria bacterium]
MAEKELTLSIIKPDGVERNIIGRIISRFEKAGLTIRALRLTRLTREEAEAFYAVHRERPFFDSLATYMTSGPIVVSVLEGYNAIQKNRELMGATNPEKADEGTIRKDFAKNVEINTVHGSDAPETAAKEIAFFFPETELIKGNR